MSERLKVRYDELESTMEAMKAYMPGKGPGTKRTKRKGCKGYHPAFPRIEVVELPILM
jgi:hypothetical protein